MHLPLVDILPLRLALKYSVLLFSSYNDIEAKERLQNI